MRTNLRSALNHNPKARPTADPRSVLFYGLPAGSGFTLKIMLWCCWGGLNSRPRHYQSKGSTAGYPAFPLVLGDCGCAFAKNPRQTQTVRRCRFGVFLLKVLWSNKIGKTDLRRTYGTVGYVPLCKIVETTGFESRRPTAPPYVSISSLQPD